ncbi:MAG TPA: hypothetical protein VE441_02980, partial [Mycobacterium sp.]|nr:hypothetical protein [Mycobacterium sp.]
MPNARFDIAAGLDADQLNTPVLPSGWALLVMIERLGHAERSQTPRDPDAVSNRAAGVRGEGGGWAQGVHPGEG